MPAAAVLVLSVFPAVASGQAPAAQGEWDPTVARGETRVVEFEAEEGTWMTVDVSSDSRWVVFDLLGEIYRMGWEGGEAECLTCDAGVAVSYQPAVSPGGDRIAFITDRGGQENLWVMEADGSGKRPVVEDLEARHAEPTWTPDGEYLLVTKRAIVEHSYVPMDRGIWMYHVEGGEGVHVVGEENQGVGGPSVGPEGRWLYYHRSDMAGPIHSVEGDIHLYRLDLQTGQEWAVTVEPGESGRDRLRVGESYAARVSPDGGRLAFARRIPDGVMEWKGHEFSPRTALWIRDLETGAERVVLDPIELDMAESLKRHWTRLLPGYAWTADGEWVVIARGGKLVRVEVETGEVEGIPFRARVRREVSEAAQGRVEIGESFEPRFPRWHTGQPGGERVAFQAVGRVWVQEGEGEARRLTPVGFEGEGLEYAPAWSPDGEWIAFTTWSSEGGHVWRARASGALPAEPERVTEEAGEWLNPAWSEDGRELVVVRGSGASFRGRDWNDNRWYELVRLPASGGDPILVTRIRLPRDTHHRVNRRQIPRPSWGPDGRIFYPERREVEGEMLTVLVSVRPDGLDERKHLTFPYADDAVVSPDGEWVAFQEGDNVYLVPLRLEGTGSGPVRVDRRAGAFPVRQLTEAGGLYPRWRDVETLEFGSGRRYFLHRPSSGRTDTLALRLPRLPRRVPAGTVALTGAQIVTLAEAGVIEAGAVVVEGARITCVGACETEVAAADTTIDVSGATIVPGWVDMHAHHHSRHRGIHPVKDWQQATALAYGITSSMDVSAWSQNVFPMADLVDAGVVIGPRIFSTGDPLYEGKDDTRMNHVTGYEVAEALVRRLVSWGATEIKQYLMGRRDQRQWIAEAARREGVTLTAEGCHLVCDLGMVLDGHAGWEHQLSQTPLYSDVTTFFGKAGITYSPTWGVSGPAPWNIEYWWAESDVWKSEKLRRFLPWRELYPRVRRRMLRPRTDYAFPFVAQAVADIIAAGGNGAIGSHTEYPGLTPHWEVWMAAEALGPEGALRVASLGGARFLGAEAELGTLEAGKLADLLVMEEDPLQDIRNTLSLSLVMKGGVLWEADTLDEVWPERAPYGEYPWVEPDALRHDVRPVSGEGR